MGIDPNITPDTELGFFNQNLAQTQANLTEVRGFVKDSVFVAKRVEDSLETFARIESAADTLADLADNLQSALKLVGKISPLKTVAKKLGDVLEDIEDALKDVRDRAQEIDEDIEDSGAKDKAEDARKKLEEYEGDLKDAAIELAEYQVSGIELECALDVVGNATLINSVDALVETPNDLVEGINNTYAGAKAAVQDLNTAIQISALDAAADAQKQLENIASKLKPLSKPMDLLSAAIKPIKWALDAADYVVDKVISPVIDPILKALGVTALFDAVSDKLKSLLPSAADLNTPADQLLDAVDELVPSVASGVSVADFLETKLDLQSLLNQSLDFANHPNLDTPDLRLGTALRDVLMGDAGDNVLSGGAGNDDLNGGLGADTFVGGAGDDTITGEGLDDRVVLRGKITEYSFEFLNGGNDVRISHTSPADPAINDGVDTVLSVETIVFGDGLEITTTALKDGLQVSDGTGGPDNPTVLTGVDDPAANKRDFLLAADASVSMDMSGGAGKDFLLGGSGVDVLNGNAGDDILDAGDSTGDVLNGNGAFDTASFKSRTSEGAMIDLGVDKGEARNASFVTNATLLNIEAVEGSELSDVLYGSEEVDDLSGQGGDDVLRGFGGDDSLSGGQGRDVLVAGSGDDILDGGADDDVFVLGEGGDNTLIGGDGFDRVVYDAQSNSAYSNFKAGLDGWIISGATQSVIEGAGNPNAALVGTDNANDIWFFGAPDKFLGDQSDKSGGTFSFDIFHELLVQPGNLTLLWIYSGTQVLTLEVAEFGAGWTTYAYSLDTNTPWQFTDNGVTSTATQAQIDTVLANITDIRIRGDLSGGTDTTRLDNVLLTDQSLDELQIEIPEESDTFRSSSGGWGSVSITNFDVVTNSERSLFMEDTDGVDGSIAYQQVDYATGIWYFEADISYLGDKSAFANGSLSYYLKNTSSTDNGIEGDNLIIKGAGLTLVYDTVAPVAGAGWTYYQVPLNGSEGWRIAGTSTAVTEAEFDAALAELEAIYIRGEFRSGADSASIDNVTLRGHGNIDDNPLLGALDILNEDAIAPVPHHIVFDGVAMTVQTQDGTGTVLSTDTLDSVEEITGTAQDDVFDAGLVDRFSTIAIKAGQGDDIITEGLGQQVFDGGRGDDTVFVTSARTDEGDAFTGGEGYDVLDLRMVEDTSWRVSVEDYSASPNTFTGYFRDTEYLSSFEGSQASSFEEIHTGEYNDRVVTDAQLLKTYGGNDYIIHNDFEGAVLDAGNGDDEIISFWAQGKEMRGGNGNDILRFLAPLDFYNESGVVIAKGGAGDDLFSTNGGNAIIEGGEGNDSLYFGGSFIGSSRADVRIDLEDTSPSEANGELFITGIENVGGGQGDDVIKGDDLSNILIGGAGDDILFGRGSLDTEELALSAGDVIFGGRGNDVIRGGLGGDLLYGGSGNDAISGGGGNDTASWQIRQEDVETASIVADPETWGRVDVSLDDIALAKFTREDNRSDMEYISDEWTQSGSSAMSGSVAVYDGAAGFSQFISLTNAGNTNETLATVSHQLDLTEIDGLIQISFDAYLIDGWDGDDINISIDGASVSSVYNFPDNFSTSDNFFPKAESTGSWSNGDWSVAPLNIYNADLGAGPENDAKFRISFTTYSFEDSLTLEISTDTDAVLGIDNVVIGGVDEAEIDVLVNIENLIGSDSNDRLEGDHKANVLTGGRGEDVLIGNNGDDTILDGEGDDVVDAGDGDDTVVAGTGSRTAYGAGDIYEGGQGRDMLDYSGLSDGVVIDMDAGQVSYSYDIDMPVWLDTETSESRAFYLNPNDAMLTPWEAYLDYQRKVSEDVPEIANWDGVYPRLDDLLITQESRSAIDQVTGFEDFSGTNFADQITTDDSDNAVWDQAGDDVVQLRGGNDTLYAGGGSSFYDGGLGIDMISYEASEGGVTIDLGLGTLARGDAANASMDGFESATGSLIGKNILKGGDDANTLIGGDNDDTLKGRSGADVLDGGAGSDVLIGDNGADRLIGGQGDDDLRGGNGADSFVFTAGHGADVIRDFATGQDVLELSGLAGISDVASAMGTADQVANDVVFTFTDGGEIRVMDMTLGQIENDLLVL